MEAFLTFQSGSSNIGTLYIDLFDKEVPKTVDNFATLCKGKYKGCSMHRLIPGFMVQGGDFTHGDGSGGESIYGTSFDDESFLHEHSRHDRRGMLSMANSGPNTNGSQFFITFRATPHLDGKHVVFGQVNPIKSAAVLDRMEGLAVHSKTDQPVEPLVIQDCGVHQPEQEAVAQDVAAAPNPDEIDIEDEEPEETPPQEDVNLPNSKNSAQDKLRNRLRNLKMKMNQARQLNRKALLKEGEKMGNEQGKAKERQRQKQQEKKLAKEEWESRHTKAMQMAATAGVDPKALVQPAMESLKMSHQQEELSQANQFAMNDFYNPEGQHRHYQRNLKSIQTSDTVHDTTTFDPLMANNTNHATEQQGARRLANEMHRRAEKAAKKRDRPEFTETDVSYINLRNKRFNQKINRTYDKATAEIRQNLERGTAL